MPGANESSTVEWQNAHWMPIDLTLPSGLVKAVTPTTAFNLSKRDRRRRIVEVDFARRDLLLQGIRQRVGVDLEPDGQRGLRRDAGADAAILLAGDGFVQLKRVAPEGLAPEGVVAEGLAALFKHRLRVARDLGVEARGRIFRRGSRSVFRGRRSECKHRPSQRRSARGGGNNQGSLHDAFPH